MTYHTCMHIYICMLYIIHTNTHTHTRFSVGFGSRDYRGWEVPPSDICKLDNQKNLWHNSVQVQSPWAPKSEDRRWWMSQLKQMELKDTLPLYLSFFSRPSTDQMMTIINEDSHWWRQYSLFSLPIQMQISFKNTFTNTLQYHVLPALWASLNSDKLTHKINHHILKLFWWVGEGSGGQFVLEIPSSGRDLDR